jgi:uncharacterized protein
MIVSMDEALLQRLRDSAEKAFVGTDVLFAYVFGSTATGRRHRRSDLDIAVYLDQQGEQKHPLDVTLELAGRFEDAYRMDMVDLIILNGATLSLQGRVLRQRVLLYSRDERTRCLYESKTFREFMDFQIHAEPLSRKLLQAIAEGRR